MTTADQLAAIEARAKAYADHGTPGLAAPADRAYLLALVREQAAKLERVEAELHHADDNGHILSGDCQGVAPGQQVPAVRISGIRAALEATP